MKSMAWLRSTQPILGLLFLICGCGPGLPSDKFNISEIWNNLYSKEALDDTHSLTIHSDCEPKQDLRTVIDNRHSQRSKGMNVVSKLARGSRRNPKRPVSSDRLSRNSGECFNYTEKGQNDVNNRADMQSDKKPTPENLVKDALIINEAFKGVSTHTTVLCVALEDLQGTIKKFVFQNAESPSRLATKAHELGYHLIQAQRSHAECQFLQFLYSFKEEYTHIIGMGCSRRHCTECDCLLNLVLGDKYHVVSAVADGEDGSRRQVVGTITDPERMVKIDKSMYFKLGCRHRHEVWEDKTYDKFIIPGLLQEIIERRIGRHINIGGERYV